MTDEDANVNIPISDVYREVRTLSEKVGGMQALLERTIAVWEQRNVNVETRVDAHNTLLDEHGKRIAQSERDIAAIQIERAQEKKEQAQREARRPTWWGVVAAGGGISAFLLIAQQVLNSVFPTN